MYIYTRIHVYTFTVHNNHNGDCVYTVYCISNNVLLFLQKHVILSTVLFFDDTFN